MSGRTGSGSFGSGRTAGYAIGEGRTSPWLEAIAGIRERPCPRLGSKPEGRGNETHQVEGETAGGGGRELLRTRVNAQARSIKNYGAGGGSRTRNNHLPRDDTTPTHHMLSANSTLMYCDAVHCPPAPAPRTAAPAQQHK